MTKELATRMGSSNINFESYDASVEDWSCYVERLESYFVVNRIEDKMKVPAILSLMGATTYKLLKNLATPNIPSELTYQDIVKLLSEHLNPKPLEMTERFRFYKRKQFEDYTLWPFWVDTHVRSPFKKENNNVIDGCGKKIKYYPEVPEVLEKLKQEGYILGVASRTDWPEGARKLLKLFDWNKYFTYTEIYPGRKTTHFRRMHEESGIPYSEMLFFDDEQRNISDLKAIGVKSVLVDDGVNLKIVEDALKSFKTS